MLRKTRIVAARSPLHRRRRFRSRLLIALLVGLMNCIEADGQEAPPAPLVLAGAKVLDAQGERFIEGQTVLVEGGRITAVGAAHEASAPSTAKKLELTGLYLIPGLIDLHTHLLLHPYNEAKWDDQVLRESLELRTIRAVAAGRATLEAGFTTIRDLGTEGAGVADVALREAFASGLAIGPRVLASTRAIVAIGCYGPAGFDPRWDVPQGADEASGEAEVRRVVRRQIADGADWIKFYADYHRSPSAPATPTFSQEEMNAIVDEARSAGLPVAAHATTPEGIRRAVRAGVSTIEHGYGATGETLTLMAGHRVALCPTLAAAEAYARYRGWKPGQPEPEDWKRAKATFALALRSGVTIACGSDAGVFAHGDNARELELMVACGMSPAQALHAATRTAAAVLGRPEELGRIAPGAAADLVALAADPLTDIAAVRQPRVVIKGGRIVVERR